MSDDIHSLHSNIQTLFKQSIMFLSGVLGIFIFGGFFILSLFTAPWTFAAVFLALLLLSVLLIIIRHQTIKKIKRTTSYILRIKQNISYAELLQILQSRSLREFDFKISSTQSIFNIKEKFDYRIMVSASTE